MSGLQDENSFSAGGGTEVGEKTKQVAQVSRPDPAAARATVEKQIAEAKQAAAQAKNAAKTEFSSKQSAIVDHKLEAIGKADHARQIGELVALVPVVMQEIKVEELERQLRREKLDLNAKKVVFSAKKGELKTAYKTAIAGIKETTKADIEAAKSARGQAVIAAEEALNEARTKGADTVHEAESLAEAYDNGQSDMKWAGRKAGFNAVAATVKAIVEAVQTTYRENRDLARANVEVPAALLKRQADGPAPTAT